MKKVFVEDLPVYTEGRYKGKINWRATVGLKVRFIYDELEDIVTIIDYNHNNGYLTLKYKGVVCEINKTHFREGKLRQIANNVVIKAPWMIPYFQGGYEEAKNYTCMDSRHSLFFKCPDCGQVFTKKIKIQNLYRYHEKRCPKCGDGVTYPNKIMFNILGQLGLKAETEYCPEWISPKRYDFHIPSMDLIIEMDGGLGHGNSLYNTRHYDSPEQTLEVDKYKEEVAKQHNKKVIRIDCLVSDLEYIKTNILNSELNNLLNLSLIDWNEVQKYSTSNLVKMACEYKKNNPSWSTIKIGEVMGKSHSTICRWLNIGNELGWCIYKPEEERKSNLKYTNIDVFNKQGEFLGNYKDVGDIQEKSEKDFGDFYRKNKIREAIKNNKFYKGLKFQLHNTIE